MTLSSVVGAEKTKGDGQAELQEGVRMNAAFGEGVTIRSADDEFSFNLRSRMQLRTTLEHDSEEEETRSGVAVRRMRLGMRGHALTPDLTYRVQLAFSNLDMEPDLRSPLRDAFLTWTPLRDVNMRFGQMKVPFGRQRVTSSSSLQMVDRSMVVAELNLDRDVGMVVFSKDLLGLEGRLGYALAVFGGEGRNRPGREHGLLYSARLEARPFGFFDDFVEGDQGREARPRLGMGVGIAYNQNTNRPQSTTGIPYPEGGFDYLHGGLDLAFKYRGLAIVGEMMVRKADRGSRPIELDGVPATIRSRSVKGAYLQAGQMVTDEVEVTVRYGRLVPLANNGEPKLVEQQETGGALSYYVYGHDLKVQGDYFHLSTEPFQGGIHQGRLQVQLFF